MEGRPPFRPIKRLLVANRGEIAARVLSSARELDIETFALHTPGDAAHAHSADRAVALSSPSDYASVDRLLELAREHAVDAVHPGYGFLSESAEFARRMWDEARVAVVGPGWGVLEQTGDKVMAKQLAERCRVPVLPSIEVSADGAAGDIRAFARECGYPVMVKAVDGGGGRGIRIVARDGELEQAVGRAAAESPSGRVFVEKAAVGGFMHVEVQVVGDGRGGVAHLWERDCSVQRRFQKVVEVAPSALSGGSLAASIIESSLLMAKSLQYLSLGTFEFLANRETDEYYFLEINPRLQVEHTITEQISGTDLVRAQLLLAQGYSLEDSGIPGRPLPTVTPPPSFSIQLRIVAEDPSNNWTPSIGKIRDARFPTGHGIRVDTHLGGHTLATVGPDFDPLLAKVIVTASTFPAAVKKAARALKDLQISGVATNAALLARVVSHPDFAARRCDAQWLKANHAELTAAPPSTSSRRPAALLGPEATDTNPLDLLAPQAPLLLRPGDAWALTLAPHNDDAQTPPLSCHVSLTRILRNDLPASLATDVLFTPQAPFPGSPAPTPTTHRLTLASASAAAGPRRRKGDPKDPRHVLLPLSGRLVEVLVDVGDAVRAGETVCVVRQMKMEVEVRCGEGGRVAWVTEAEDGEEVEGGMLVAVVEPVGVGGEEKVKEKL